MRASGYLSSFLALVLAAALAPGPRLAAQPAPGELGRVYGLAVDRDGAIIASLPGESAIVSMRGMGGEGFRRLGRSGGGDLCFDSPFGLAVDAGGRILVLDWKNRRLVRFDAMDGAGWTALAFSAIGVEGLRDVRGVAVGGDGRIYLADTGKSRILRIDGMDGANPVVLGGVGSGPRQFSAPTDLAFGPDGRLYVADGGNGRVVRMEGMDGSGWESLALPAAVGSAAWPCSLAFGPGGELAVLDMGGRLYLYARFAGEAGREIASGFSDPATVRMDGRGNLYVADSRNQRIVMIGGGGERRVFPPGR